MEVLHSLEAGSGSKVLQMRDCGSKFTVQLLVFVLSAAHVTAETHSTHCGDALPRTNEGGGHPWQRQLDGVNWFVPKSRPHMGPTLALKGGPRELSYQVAFQDREEVIRELLVKWLRMLENEKVTAAVA